MGECKEKKGWFLEMEVFSMTGTLCTIDVPLDACDLDNAIKKGQEKLANFANGSETYYSFQVDRPPQSPRVVHRTPVSSGCCS